MLGAMVVLLELHLRQAEALAARRQRRHHAAALAFAHRAPARDLVERAGAAHADVALRIHDAHLHARRLHAERFAARALFTLEVGSRLRMPQIHWPMPASLSRSTPVSMPRPCSMYTTSSVATLPEAPLA